MNTKTVWIIPAGADVADYPGAGDNGHENGFSRDVCGSLPTAKPATLVELHPAFVVEE
ncbi:MAG: hypothetical protein R3C29_03025 [Dehalococcoidia bacterium]